ncbi:4-hydroxy-tetrahydrodipicolinate reductase [Thermosipho ferrireducens]|uniref:4-hydroxy-tetrahydrodipicolinate reductase n=1 Tax=Thermosipho ferrireducens TaxID=2571116 RepID=A0ABX7S864_9BACT|nr:dihydrodipicolinate reductase C-terminal domain-containing protein [Thermosipho ferrireducens]QTA38782.1 4-hydroxy-tetrahydrodipicolinate reductase [Thermosipho ferrireducens]
MNFGVVGYKGRMGTLIVQTFKEHKHNPVLLVDKEVLLEKDRPEVIVDFSQPEALELTLSLCEKYNVPLVLGTTALAKNHFKTLKDFSKKQPVVQSYNFSIGINLIAKILAEFSKNFEEWDVELVEIHHSQKKDKPSGTAILLEKALKREIQKHSLRIGGIPGEHLVIFANEGETITISHRAISRKAFALGALKAAEWVLTRKSGFYTFSDVLKEE